MEIQKDFSPLAEKKGLEFDLEPLAELKAFFDPDHIHRVMNNLVSNALKFTPSGGGIRIFAERQQDLVIVAVEDTGKGIPQDRLGDLFQEFVQIGENDSCQGAGLGLSICQKIIDVHHGRIWVDSVLGEGSRFSFTLPALAPPLSNP